MCCQFYVYCLVLNKEIIYIGKGKKDRSKKHLPLLLANKHVNQKLQNKFNKVNNKEQLQDIIIYDNLTEELSYQYEIQLIDQIGLDNLCNLTDGGEGGDCITNNPRRSEIIEKSAKSRIGRKVSTETKQRIQAAKQKWYSSQEYEMFKKTLSETRKGDKNPMYGKKESDEHKKERMKNLLSKPRWNKGLQNLKIVD